MITGNKAMEQHGCISELRSFIDSTGLKGANLEDKFLIHVFCCFQYYQDGEKGCKLPCVFEGG